MDAREILFSLTENDKERKLINIWNIDSIGQLYVYKNYEPRLIPLAQRAIYYQLDELIKEEKRKNQQN